MNGDLKYLLVQRATLVWFGLVAATCLSWWLGSDIANADAKATQLTATVLMVVAFLKVRFVIRDFMEVRESRLALRLVTDLWCILVAATVLSLYWDMF